MTVQDLNRVHRRYVRVSSGFKSAWTFHQFIQGLRKVFVDEGPPDYPADFQTVYGELKQASQNLSEVTAELADELLDRVEEGLEPLVDNLKRADEEISPGLLRQFFQRVKNYDDNILTQLVKFYLYFRENAAESMAAGLDSWSWDRLDKADYLSTKVFEEYHDATDLYSLRDRTHIREVAQGFWAALGIAEPDQDTVKTFIGELQNIRNKVAAVESIDELNQQDLVQRYRDFKHRLGDVFFHPAVLQEIVETNLLLKNHVQKLYHRDEQRIVAEYQQVFELERDVPTDVKLREELAEFRTAVEQFEGRLQGGRNIRLEELAVLREKVREILPRLQPNQAAIPTPHPPEVREARSSERIEEKVVPAAGRREENHVAENFETIISVLDDTTPAHDLKKVAFQPEVFALRLEPREVLAYRLLYSDSPCDRELEEGILYAAAYRVQIEHEVDEIKGILDDTAATRDSPIFARARTTLRYADRYLRRFEHLIDQALLAEDHAEGRALQVLRMRLLRSYSGLWLKVFKE